ncbi:MAG: TonB-dependent receptor plug domain-containing protein [Ignavibacteria bacterium]
MSLVSGVNAQTDFDSSFCITPLINVSANRLPILRENSPFSVQFIDRESIDKINGSQLSDVLKNANNVYVKSYGGNSSLKTVSINGLSAEHTLILLNGVRLNSTQNAQFDISLLPKEFIESIEIIPSGSSASYGSDALSGVINIKTISSGSITHKNSFNTELGVDFGSYGYAKYNLSLSGRLKYSSFKILYSNESSKDDFEYYYFNGKENELKTRYNNSYDRDNLFLDYTYDNSSSKLSLVSYYNTADRFLPGIETGSDPSNANQKDKNWNTIVNFEKKGKNLFNASLNFQNNLINFSPYPNSTNYYKNLIYSASAHYLINNSVYKLLLGGEYSASSIESDQLAGNKQRNTSALFISNETRILENFVIFPSARFESISDIDRQVLTAKIGLNYKPFKNDILILKSSAGNSFRSPSFNELYWKTGGNINLLPEKSISFEAGFLTVFRLFSNNTFEFTYTHINAADKILWKPGNSVYWTPENVGNSLSNIISLTLNSDYIISKSSSVMLNLNYTYNSSIKNNMDYQGDLTYGKQLIYIANNMFKLNLNFDIKDFGFGAGSVFIGNRYSDVENRNLMNPDFILDGNIYYKLHIGKINTLLKLEVNNITNENYQVISGYPMPLRNFRFLIKLKY